MKLDKDSRTWFPQYEPGDRVVLPVSPALQSPRVDLLIGVVQAGNSGPRDLVAVRWPGDHAASGHTSRIRAVHLALVPPDHRGKRWRSDRKLPNHYTAVA